MKTLALEFAEDVLWRKENGKRWCWGRFESEGPQGFDYELDSGYDEGPKHWTVRIDSIQIHDESGDVRGWYSQKELAAFIIDANEELNKIGLDYEIHVSNGE